MLGQLKIARLIWMPVLLAVGGSSLLHSQVAAPAYSAPNFGVFASFGGLKTHVINYTYNALGVEGGVFLQRAPLFGFEARGATYPMYARYSQSPITGGYRLDLHAHRLNDLQLNAYFGGGMSRAQSALVHYQATPAAWSPCWQASQSMTISMGHLSWKPYDATFTQTFTSQRTLEGFSLTTGLVYSFKNNRY
jgi:hypothetical protein